MNSNKYIKQELKNTHNPSNDFYTLLGFVAPKQKCAVKVVATIEHCTETATKKINGDDVCCRCYENWKHLELNNA
jgi:hypothetical protein